MTKCTTIESLKEELKEFEKEEISKVMNKYQCKNCGNLSDNLEIKKTDSSEQLERFRDILSQYVGSSPGLYFNKKLSIASFRSRLAYVECPVCRLRNYFEVYKTLDE